MKAMKAKRNFDQKLLLPGDSNDPESSKVSRGVVGGYRDDLTTDDIAYLEDALKHLDPQFGYSREASASSKPVN